MLSILFKLMLVDWVTDVYHDLAPSTTVWPEADAVGADTTTCGPAVQFQIVEQIWQPVRYFGLTKHLAPHVQSHAEEYVTS